MFEIYLPGSTATRQIYWMFSDIKEICGDWVLNISRNGTYSYHSPAQTGLIPAARTFSVEFPVVLLWHSRYVGYHRNPILCLYHWEYYKLYYHIRYLFKPDMTLCPSVGSLDSVRPMTPVASFWQVATYLQYFVIKIWRLWAPWLTIFGYFSWPVLNVASRFTQRLQ